MACSDCKRSVHAYSADCLDAYFAYATPINVKAVVYIVRRLHISAIHFFIFTGSSFFVTDDDSVCIATFIQEYPVLSIHTEQLFHLLILNVMLCYNDYYCLRLRYGRDSAGSYL